MKEITKALSMLFQVGITMLVPIFMCVIIGAFLDNIFHTGGICVIIFVILGVGAAFRSLYMLTKSFFKDDESAPKKKESDDE